AAEIAHESEERRIVEPFAGHVVPLAHLRRPGAGVGVPVSRDVGFGDLGLAHGQPLAGVRASMDTIPAPKDSHLVKIARLLPGLLLLALTPPPPPAPPVVPIRPP